MLDLIFVWAMLFFQSLHLTMILFQIRSQDDFQMDPDSYNGAVRKNYIWSQDYSDIEIKVPVPKDVVKGKQVTWTIKCIKRGYVK